MQTKVTININGDTFGADTLAGALDTHAKALENKGIELLTFTEFAKRLHHKTPKRSQMAYFNQIQYKRGQLDTAVKNQKVYILDSEKNYKIVL